MRTQAIDLEDSFGWDLRANLIAKQIEKLLLNTARVSCVCAYSKSRHIFNTQIITDRPPNCSIGL